MAFPDVELRSPGSAFSVNLSGTIMLIVADGAHAHFSDAINLTQQNVLVAQDALHAHATDAVMLQPHLVVEDAAHSTSPQLINDGGFERWTSLTNLAQWSEQKGGTTRIERSTSEKQEGTSSVAFIGDGSGSYARLSQTITLQVNTVYTMRIRHKASAALFSAQLTLTNNSTGHALDASGGWTGPYLSLNIDTSWSEEGWISWKTESTGTSFNLELYVSGGSFANQTIWFDMFTISKDLVLTPHLVVADATHAHAADTPTLVQQHLIIVSEATHAQLAESPTLVQQHLLSVAEALHAHAAEAPTLVQQHLLAVSECLHAHLADNVVLQTAGALQVQDATHAHAAETPSLAQQNTLVVQESLHAHAAEVPTLTPTWTLAVAEALHAHSVDGIVLTQQNILGISDALHAHSADNVTLMLSLLLIVSDAQHAHRADEIVLSMLGYFDLIVVNVNPRERIVEVRLHERIQDAQQRERIVETRPRERVVDSDVRERIIEAEDLR